MSCLSTAGDRGVPIEADHMGGADIPEAKAPYTDTMQTTPHRLPRRIGACTDAFGGTQ